MGWFPPQVVPILFPPNEPISLKIECANGMFSLTSGSMLPRNSDLRLDAYAMLGEGIKALEPAYGRDRLNERIGRLASTQDPAKGDERTLAYLSLPAD